MSWYHRLYVNSAQNPYNRVTSTAVSKTATYRTSASAEELVQKQAGSKLCSAPHQSSPHGDVRDVTGQQSREGSGEGEHGKSLAGLSGSRKNLRALNVEPGVTQAF